MLYLCIKNEGRKKFQLTDTEALKERDIKIGDGASIGDEASIFFKGVQKDDLFMDKK
jgi:hypothetical protein